MKKRGGRYCNGKVTTGYNKGQPCCASATVEGPDGKGYCRNHVGQAPKKSKKKCPHNIITHQKYGEPWFCGRCGKKMSNAEMRRRMPT